MVERETFSGRLVEYVVRVGATDGPGAMHLGDALGVGAQVTLRLPPERCIIVNGVPAAS